MKMSQLVGRRLKEDPKDAKTLSHKFLIRGGYVRMVSAGIYSILPLGKIILAKIESIIREEMNRIDGQEVLMPVVLPAELWQESGRYESVGPELLRFKDRNDKPMLLAMTHEEGVVHLLRSEVNSYKQLPVMLYQIQTKYRDEARPRGGLIRVREFTMKDGYSFHVNQADLEIYYQKAHHAYERIFQRLGMREVLSIEANSGMMGGKVSHEFMAICDCGEDTIFTTADFSYRANREVARADWKFTKPAPKALEKVHTPGQKSIEEVTSFLNLTPENAGKAVFYQNATNGDLIFVLIRGDFEVNESKLANLLKIPELKFADDEAIKSVGAIPGYASPINLAGQHLRVVVDHSAAESGNLVVGANEENFHYLNFNADRDLADVEYQIADVATARAGDPSPIDGQPLVECRGIEVGNIFQLGTRYSEAMKCDYLDSNGKSHPMTMGCYGIGVGRAMASVIEQSNDQYGPIWPISIAPFQVHICALNIDKGNVREKAEALYRELQSLGVEVLLDDRGEKAGFMFNDADLIGAPFRVTISPKTLENNQVEFKIRGERDFQLLSLEKLATELKRMIDAELAKYQ